ncbi:type II toxin-antitoxin system YoeB family toxin [Longimicrobium sp.]|uniref:type II toxin-antitoxin system YoeB family toxin n=1 Tax=Longimicrobium sp. TaxID=2029185 RepID=UPI002B94E2C2|nr:type II toxin-antitoxin system YoeB family toxin [Longimicrobium sp.]HSU17448.1 type II toxin-antitoxin system YoeB family toxin [Longimicrobium sp.]
MHLPRIATMTPPGRPRTDGPEEETPLVVSTQFLLDLAKWVAEAPRTAAKVLHLMLEIARDPREGIGKPKPLKHSLGR